MPSWQSMLPGLDEPMTVTEATARVKARLESDPALADARISGEISNLVRPASGHIYFTLKDAGAQMKCVMWRSAAARLRAYVPKSGDAVIARGKVSVYERDGAYQLYVENLAPSGVGDLYAEFERLKQKLSDEGLFDAARKRELPEFPRVLGVVTSPTAAAFQDIQNVLRRRFPLIEVILAPTLVQGAEAPFQIVRAIERLNLSGLCDVILVARGGGSLEELWAFNDERVARAIAASDTPVVSGVGHEIDFTLADFAADVRAPTPSAAAELITPDGDALRQEVDALAARSTQILTERLLSERGRLEAVRRALRALSPAAKLTRAREQVRDLGARLSRAMSGQIALDRAALAGAQGKLEAYSPLATLARGYAIVSLESDATVVRAVHQAEAGAALRIRVSDGELGAVSRGAAS